MPRTKLQMRQPPHAQLGQLIAGAAFMRSTSTAELAAAIPADETVRAMSEISGLAPLSYWHLCNKSTLAADMLPDVEQLPLPQAVVQLLVAIEQFGEDHGNLLAMAADGKISADEALEWQGIKKRLDLVVKAALQVKVAEGGDG